MAGEALKIVEAPKTERSVEPTALSPTREFPIYHLLTRILIDSLCPVLKSEIMFGEIKNLEVNESFDYWIGDRIEGDLRGTVGIGIDKQTLRNLATNLKVKSNGTFDLHKTIIALHKALSDSMDKEFAVEDFRIHLKSTDGVHEHYSLPPTYESVMVCPVETKCGILKLLFLLKPASQGLIEELGSREVNVESRKIRVFASQIESIFAHVKALGQLESKLLTGPHIRAQMRSEIKKMKRMVHYLKSESFELLFAPARKLAVEIAKQQGKQMRLVTQGTWLYLDKTLLNYLYEPILHLVRNAVDHGIEEPSERERVGKPATGVIKCHAAFGEGGLRLILSDDGHGIDFSKVRERAVAKGLMTVDEANTKLSEELCELIFKSGFTTRDRADSISGRGLGLDIVRRAIEEVSGTIRILSTSHHGTSFEIRIPLNEDFGAIVKRDSAALSNRDREEEERQVLIDELSTYFERLTRTLNLLKEESSRSAAYEAYRLAHSIKGTAGFLGWNRVASFCHHYEELLKLIAEEKAKVDPTTLTLIMDGGKRMKEFCDASKSEATYSLYEVRKIEVRILQIVWSVTHSDERTYFYFGKYHLNSVEKMLMGMVKQGAFSAKPEIDIAKAISQPYGTLVQFNGDRRGYAGILMPETTFQKVIHPFVTGNYDAVPVKSQIWALSEFANLMGSQLSEYAQKSGIVLHPSAPLTYFGHGQPLRILGNPTYCYSCELNGHPFYLVGDFRTPQEMAEKIISPHEVQFSPTLIINEATRQSQQYFSHWGLGVDFQEVSSQSDLVGFDGGITAIITCVTPGLNKPSSVLFLSYEPSLAEYVHQKFVEESQFLSTDRVDLYDCLNETSNIIGGRLIAELEKKRLNLSLSLPTVFVGKAYVANFNRLFITNKWVGTTDKGRFELQVLVTQVPDR